MSEVSIHVLATNKGGAGQERGCECKLRHEVGGYEDQKGDRIVGWVTCEIKDKESEWNEATYMPGEIRGIRKRRRKQDKRIRSNKTYPIISQR